MFRYQHDTNFNHPSVFTPSSHHPNESISYAKPAEIYVYARKRPLLSSESNFRDTISIPDNKHMIMIENKSNLDSTPLLKKVIDFSSAKKKKRLIWISHRINRLNFNLIKYLLLMYRINKYSKIQSYHFYHQIIEIILNIYLFWTNRIRFVPLISVYE